jgi:hypothetical protein
MFSSKLPVLCSFLALLSLSACEGGGNGGTTTPILPPAVATVSVTAASTTPLLPGGTVQLAARALTAAGAEVASATISWSSSTTTVATVSTTGLVTAVGAGTTTISATSGAVSGTAAVQVNPGGIVGNTGGTVSAAAGAVTLQLPAGAVTGSTPITVTPKPDTIRTEHTVGPAYFFGPTGTTFAQPVTIAIKYDTTQLPAYTDKAALRVARLTNGKWVPLTESVVVDSATNTVRAATRSFSGYGVVREPCLPLAAGTGSIVGQISSDDCLFTTAGRRSDYYTLRPSNGEVIILTGSGPLDGLFGLKEATADPSLGTVWNSNAAITSQLRLLSNGDPLQLFVSGRDSTKLGNYSFVRTGGTSQTVAHECVTSSNGKSYIGMMPGTEMRGTMAVTNSCEVIIQFSPNPAAIGKPLLVHNYPVRLLGGRQYTITGTGFAPQSSLTAFRLGTAGVAGQDVSTGTTRTFTITPASTAYYSLEIGSGGFQNANSTGGWIQPAFTYTVSVSRGTATP